MNALKKDSTIQLDLILGASAVVRKFGNLEEQIISDGFEITQKCDFLLSEQTPLNMAQACGLGMISISTALENLKPDCLVIIGDRYEMMAATLSAAFMNITILHTMGGEVTGTIDESNRHAITKYANYHFVANEDAKTRVIKLGEVSENVFNIGCPRNDMIREVLEGLRFEERFSVGSKSERLGVGADIDFETEPFVIFSYHPITTEFDQTFSDYSLIVDAVNQVGLKVLALWPNADAGSDIISQIIRKQRENKELKNFRFYRNLDLPDYIACMSKAKCIIGNSSSGIRDGSFIGTPCVDIGTRQNRRLKGQNTISVPVDKGKILQAIRQQVAVGKYEADTIYGDGHASRRFCEILNSLAFGNTQKVITY